MRRMVEKIIAQYGTDMRLTSGTETKTVRAFFRAVNAKSWQSMESEATLLGEISRGQYAYIGPVGAQVREGDTLTLGDKTYLFRRALLLPQSAGLPVGAVRGEGCERYLGISILELVLRRLREAKFTADVAFPGQKFPQITKPVAAVHIEKVDRANMTVTVEVNIICPAAMGGTACEVEALRATEILRWSGAVCIQNGCTYDGISQVYVVAILATFTCVTEASKCSLGPGFRAYINDIVQPNAIAFSEEEVSGVQAEYVTGESAPAGASQGSSLWYIQLEELFPAGTPEKAEPVGAFTLEISTDVKTELYYHCRWTSVKREFSREGLRKTRKGIAMLRQEEE